jgi:hypothetical protein
MKKDFDIISTLQNFLDQDRSQKKHQSHLSWLSPEFFGHEVTNILKLQIIVDASTVHQ